MFKYLLIVLAVIVFVGAVVMALVYWGSLGWKSLIFFVMLVVFVVLVISAGSVGNQVDHS